MCPYFFEPHRWMISAYKTALYLSKSCEVVVLTVGKPRFEQLNPNLKIYRMWDLFIPDPVNYSVVPSLLFSLIHVIRSERPTHFIVNKHMFFTSFSILILRMMRKKVITVTDTFPGVNWFPRNRYVSKVMRLYARLIGMPLLKLSNRVVLLHEGLIEVAKQYRLKGQVVHNGVDLELADQALPARDIRTKGLRVVYVGRLESIKGYYDLLDVAEAISQKRKNIYFYFVGSTSGKEELVERYKTVRQIIFLGHRTDVASILKKMDVFVLPSYSEGLPNALMEAMASGLACISSSVGGVKYLIKDGKNGMLINPGDQDRLARCVTRLADSAQLRQELGKNARATIEKSYSWQKIAKQYQSLLRSL